MAKGLKTGGRAKGTPNKVNGQVREMMIAALHDLGGKEYFVTQALQNPGAFLKLVEKVLPLQVRREPGESPIVSPIVKRVIIDPKDADQHTA